FLALVLRKALHDRCQSAGFEPEWQDVRLDLDRLQEAELEKDGKRLIIRTPATGTAGKLFQAVGVALPANIQEIAPAG
ncbi:MAG: transposase, partial [Hyphomicrobiales bacterium]|nr:transposase [Hyphomicrobiales bacterium]